MPRRRVAKKKQRQSASAASGSVGSDNSASEGQEGAPASIVVRRGRLDASCRLLVRDWRQVMGPRVAAKLRESRRNKRKDFVSVAGCLGVSHFQTLTQTDNGVYLRVAKLPRGPTVTFQMSEALNLTSSMLRSLFAPVDVRTAKAAKLTAGVETVLRASAGGAVQKQLLKQLQQQQTDACDLLLASEQQRQQSQQHQVPLDPAVCSSRISKGKLRVLKKKEQLLKAKREEERQKLLQLLQRKEPKKAAAAAGAGTDDPEDKKSSSSSTRKREERSNDDVYEEEPSSSEPEEAVQPKKRAKFNPFTFKQRKSATAASMQQDQQEVQAGKKQQRHTERALTGQIATKVSQPGSGSGGATLKPATAGPKSSTKWRGSNKNRAERDAAGQRA
ncbi:ribosome biogenesis protein [Cyclospora cayetanensis]|uniref:Ribosome biogenesis protein n=1 Tax=Cyclospora cayetanensis TaxID=88456 RepID=A0A1D3D6S3_9EIME|nr:ribosome biogenesis protein [Cyclospora cayetanensis]